MNTIFYRSARLLVIAFLISLTTGCATKLSTKQEAFPNMYGDSHNTVLVLPALNETTAAEASDYYSATIAPAFTQFGYYVLPTEVTNTMLRNEGIEDGRQLLGVPAEKFQTMFGADAVLFVQITEWDTNYYVIGGNVEVAISFQLKSTSTGETLWSYNVKRAIDTSGNSNSGGLLGAIIATAIQTSMQDYMPIAHRVNNTALQTIPFGKYHPNHEKDGHYRTVNPELVKTEID